MEMDEIVALRARLAEAERDCNASALAAAKYAGERDAAERDLDEAGRILGFACVASSLAPGERPKDPMRHAAIDGIIALLDQRDTAHADLAAMTAERNRALHDWDEEVAQRIAERDAAIAAAGGAEARCEQWKHEADTNRLKGESIMQLRSQMTAMKRQMAGLQGQVEHERAYGRKRKQYKVAEWNALVEQRDTARAALASAEAEARGLRNVVEAVKHLHANTMDLSRSHEGAAVRDALAALHPHPAPAATGEGEPKP